jgi:uncharacterized protein (DUF302 family)
MKLVRSACLFALAIACIGLYSVWKSLPSVADMHETEAGLVYVSSKFSVAETGDRVEALLEEGPLNLFARIDHAQNALSVDKQLPPTQVLIFGNPNAGTPLMQCGRSVAIDLPQKMLIWQEDDQTWLAYNSPRYLMERHNLIGCEETIEMIGQALNRLAIAATQD